MPMHEAKVELKGSLLSQGYLLVLREENTFCLKLREKHKPRNKILAYKINRCIF